MEDFTVIQPIIDRRYFFVKGFKLSSGEKFHVLDFFEYCKTVERTMYTEILSPLARAAELAGMDFKGNGDFKLKIGGVTIISLHQWAMGLKADKKSEEKIASLVTYRGVPATSGIAAIVDYVGATRSQKADPLLLGEVLCSITEETGIPKDGIQAYRPGMLGMPAEPRKYYKDVKSYDLTSAYPAACLTNSFPSGPSTEVDISGEVLIDSRGKLKQGDWTTENLGYIAKFRVTGARRKDWVRICSIQESDILDSMRPHVKLDRIGLESGDFIFSACMPEVALFVLQFTYEKIDVLELYTHEMAPLPETTLKVIRKWYKDKAEGGFIQKLKLNSLIGCWGRSPLKFPNKPINTVRDAEVVLSIYNGRMDKKPVSLGGVRTWDFRWAIYAVACVRLTMGRIERSLYSLGCEVLYSDTDSIKFSGDPGQTFVRYNNAVTKHLGSSGIGLFKDEGDKYTDGAIFLAKRSYLSSSGGVVIPHLAGIQKSLATEQLSGTTLEELSDRVIVLLTPIWSITELPDDRFGMKYLPLRAMGRVELGKL